MNAAAGAPFGGRSVRLTLGGDERLAQLAAAGSERAFAALYERYHSQLYRYCRSIVYNDADAQDALQSTLTGAYVALRRGQRDAPLRPWLFRIAHNESVSVLRRRHPEEQLSELFVDAAASTEEQVEQRERLALLIADLRELPERQRGALVMRELSDLSHEQIAIALRTSVGAAKQAIFEARCALLEFAEGRTMACETLQRTISDADGRALRSRRVRAHLRHCPSCAAFAAAIPARRATLRASAPLPVIIGSELLARLVGGITADTVPGAGAAVVGAAGKTTGAVLASKAVVGVAIVASTTAAASTALGPAQPSTTPGTELRATARSAPPASGPRAIRAGMRRLPQSGPGPRIASAATPHGGWAGRTSPAVGSATVPAAAHPKQLPESPDAGAHPGSERAQDPTGPPLDRGNAKPKKSPTGPPTDHGNAKPKKNATGPPADRGKAKPKKNATGPPADPGDPTPKNRPADPPATPGNAASQQPAPPTDPRNLKLKKHPTSSPANPTPKNHPADPPADPGNNPTPQQPAPPADPGDAAPKKHPTGPPAEPGSAASKHPTGASP